MPAAPTVFRATPACQGCSPAEIGCCHRDGFSVFYHPVRVHSLVRDPDQGHGLGPQAGDKGFAVRKGHSVIVPDFFAVYGIDIEIKGLGSMYENTDKEEIGEGFRSQDSETFLRYQSLSYSLKMIVRFLAVNIGPCAQSRLPVVLEALGMGLAKGRKLTLPGIRPYLDELEGKGVILKTSKGLCCAPSILSRVVQDSVLDDSFPVIAEVIIAATPGIEDPFHPAVQHDYEKMIRALLIGIFVHYTEEKLETAIHQARTRFFHEYNKHNPFLLIFSTPFNPEVMEKLFPALRQMVLGYIIDAADRHLEPCHEVLDYLVSQPGSLPGIAQYQVVESYLLRGRTDDAEAGIARIRDQEDFFALSGWLEFIRGNNERALAHFDACIVQIKKSTRKRNVNIPGLPGLFFLLAAIKAGGDFRHQQAMHCIDYGFRSISLDPVSIVMMSFSDLLQQGSGMDYTDFNHLLLDRNEPVSALLFLTARTWVSPKRMEQAIPFLMESEARAEDAGLTWVAAEMAALLARLGKNEETNLELSRKLHEQCGTRSFVDMVTPEAEWKRKLNALISISTESGPGSAPVDTDQRLIWLITHNEIHHTCHLFPRLQKRSLKGGWTKGRAVAMKNLYHTHASMPGLTDQDRRLCGTIEAFSHRSYGYYGSTVEYSFDMSRALPALVGHPLVFQEEAPDVRVELVMGEPEVRIRKKQGKMTLTMTPMPDLYGEGNVLVVKESPARFKVIRLEDKHRKIASLVGPGLVLPEEAESMAKQAIDAISSLVTVQSDLGATSAVTEVVADAAPHVHIMPFQNGLRFELLVKPFGPQGPVYKPGRGGSNVLARIDSVQQQACRDLARENELAGAVVAACPSLDALWDTDSWEFTADDPEMSLEILLELKGCDLEHDLEWPQGESLKVRNETTFRNLSMAIKQDRDWFKATGSLDIDENLALDLSRLLDLLDSATGRFIPLDDGTFLAITRALQKQLESLKAYSTGHGKGLRFPPLASLALEGLTGNLETLKTDRAFKDLCQRLNHEIHPEIPGTLQANLRDYQVEGFNWLSRLSHWGVGGCLADDMGLGKTVQAIAALLPGACKGPTLVVAPLSVMSNWQEECLRFAPTLNPLVFGPGDRQAFLDGLMPFDIVISSYGLLQKEAEMLGLVQWQSVVLDEAQAIKNMKTKRSKAAMALNAKFRLITTGTPVENHLDELWTLFNFINPGLLGSYRKFNQTFAIPIERDQDKEARNRLRKLIQPVILRRLKSDVLQELPPKTEITLHVEMSREEQALYEAQRRRSLEAIADCSDDEPGRKHLRILAEIMKLRRMCCNPGLVVPDCGIESSKLRVFKDVVRELMENKHKPLVFSQFVDHLTLLRNYLDQEKISYQYLDGSTPVKQRKERIDAFQQGNGDVFLISLKAGGSGLNLTAADYVIHMDPWWNPAVEDQASDRAHRIGQKRPVTVYRLVVKNSIEEMIVKLHQEKRDLAGSLLAGSDMAGRISAEELVELLRGTIETHAAD